MRIENAGQPLCLPISIMENMPRHLRRPVLAVLTAGLLLGGVPLGAEPVTVRHQEGVVHGFLALRTLDGSTIAAGDLLQTSRGTRVTSRLVFHFRDGSLHDETAVFSQRGTFRLISDHLTQSGPSFPHPLDMTIDAASGTGRRSVGKQPPDSHVWIMEGEAPAFVKAEQALYPGGPVWRIELVSPEWPRTP